MSIDENGSGATGSGRNNNSIVNYDYDTSPTEKNNYSMRPLSFNGDATQFSWGKSQMYNHIIGVDDELWDIIEDDVGFTVDAKGLVVDRNTLTKD